MTDHTEASRVFLIGSAASQAMSPELWNPVLRRLRSSWTYDPWDVGADAEMEAVRRRLLAPDTVAANVTMPHKPWAASIADHAAEEVKLGGACNLLVRKGSVLHGHNTDITAATILLRGQWQRHVLMMGAGGAARAVLIALRGNASKVSISDRDPGAAADLLVLARDLGMDGRVVSWGQAQGLAADASLIVNATPLGKATSDGPVWGGGPLAHDALVYDFVYAAHATASVARARELGIPCVDGWDHLREQAVAMVPLLGLDQQATPLLQERLEQLRVAV